MMQGFAQMHSSLNLTEQMTAWFPAEVLERLRQAGQIARELGYSLYLIGGGVRDLLLRRPFDWDLDLVSDTPGIEILARSLQARWGGTLHAYPQYGTATLKLDMLEVDFATARTEVYAYPGANPEVHFSSLQDDLIRRDFTINAMALDLWPERFGQLIDYFDGKGDLEARLLRSLHANKFIEDPVRCWRAARLGQSLGFKIESWTAGLIQAAMDSGSFDGFVSARVLRELLKVLASPNPLPYLESLASLRVLRCLDAELSWPDWKQFIEGAKQEAGLFKTEDPVMVYLLGALLAMSPQAQERSLRAFELKASQIQAWQALQALLAASWQGLSASQAYQRLHKLPASVYWALLASPAAQPALKQAVLDYWQRWRFIRLSVSGTILKEWIPAGPGIREILQALLFAHLDGLITTSEQEFALARQLADHVSESK